MRITAKYIDIDDGLMHQALDAGPYKTKKDAVEAGLTLLGRQARYREVLKWDGKLPWQGDAAIDWSTTASPSEQAATVAHGPAAQRHRRGRR